MDEVLIKRKLNEGNKEEKDAVDEEKYKRREEMDLKEKDFLVWFYGISPIVVFLMTNLLIHIY